jgi:hypothetical protein
VNTVKNDKTPGHSPTRTREANENARIIFKLIHRDPTVGKKLLSAGVRVIQNSTPVRVRDLERNEVREDTWRNMNRLPEGWTVICEVTTSFAKPEKGISEPWTDLQRGISDLMSSDENKTMWTSYELARYFDTSVHKIGRDCEAIHAHSRQVARLVGSQRCRVYSLDDLSGMTPTEIRTNYRRQPSKPRLSQPSTNA